jgi:hypothetical protein
MPEFLQLMEDWRGFRSARPLAPRFSHQELTEALALFSNTGRLPSHRHEFLLREALTSGDFPALFGVLLDQQLLARYSAWVPAWQAYCPTGTLADFNVARLHKVYGNDEYLPQVAERAPYPETVPGAGFYTRQVAKHGRSFGISFEARVNDFLDAFSDIPQRFATAVVRTRARDVTATFSGAAGPNAGQFGAPIADVDGQNVTNLGALPLTIANLQATLLLMSQQTDPNGEPILVRGVHLVVPPALEFTARAILNSAMVQQVDTVGGANANPPAYVPLPVVNVVAQYGVQLHVDPFLPIVDLTANRNGTWYVFADPGQGKAIQMDYLRGHEAPEICLKASNKVSTSGGAISPFDGDFESDNIEYRVREIHGTAHLDPRFCYAQVAA